MSETFLTVLEDGRPIVFTHDDIIAYHGYGFPGGVAHGFKAMERALPLLDPGHAPERREIKIRTPFRGPGARDAFELVTRCLTENRYTVDPALAKPERGDLLKGYVFIFEYRGTSVTLQITPGHVRPEFIELGRMPDRTPAQEERLTFLKGEMAERLMALPASELYEVCDKRLF